jgi:hypothetical protein
MTTTTSRRAILAGAASMPALAIPAIATATSDPIYAAIERHKIALAQGGEGPFDEAKRGTPRRVTALIHRIPGGSGGVRIASN